MTRTERLAAAGVCATCVGVALSLVSESGLPGALTLLGFVATVVAVHRLGRRGVEAAPTRDAEPTYRHLQ